MFSDRPVIYRHVFETPNIPGVVGSEARGITLDPLLAQQWLQQPTGRKQELDNVAHLVLAHRDLTISQWQKWHQIWRELRSTQGIQFHVSPEAVTMAKKLQDNPGCFWSRFFQERTRSCSPANQQNYQRGFYTVVTQVADQKALSYQGWYHWTMICDALQRYETHPQTASENWTVASAVQCLQSAAFWESYEGFVDPLQLWGWLTNRPAIAVDALQLLWDAWFAWNAPHPARFTGTFDYGLHHSHPHSMNPWDAVMLNDTEYPCTVTARVTLGTRTNPTAGLELEQHWLGHAAFQADESTWNEMVLEALVNTDALGAESGTLLDDGRDTGVKDDLSQRSGSAEDRGFQPTGIASNDDGTTKPVLNRVNAASPSVDTLGVLPWICEAVEQFTDSTPPSEYLRWATQGIKILGPVLLDLTWWQSLAEWASWSPKVKDNLLRIPAWLATYPQVAIQSAS